MMGLFVIFGVLFIALFTIHLNAQKKLQEEKLTQIILEKISIEVSANKTMVLNLLEKYIAFFSFITPWSSDIVNYLSSVELDTIQYKQLKKMKTQVTIFNSYVAKLNGTALRENIKIATIRGGKKTPLVLSKNLEAYSNVTRVLESEQLANLSFTSVYPVYMDFIEHLHEIYLSVLPMDKNKEVMRYFNQAVELRRDLDNLLAQRRDLRLAAERHAPET